MALESAVRIDDAVSRDVVDAGAALVGVGLIEEAGSRGEEVEEMDVDAGQAMTLTVSKVSQSLATQRKRVHEPMVQVINHLPIPFEELNIDLEIMPNNLVSQRIAAADAALGAVGDIDVGELRDDVEPIDEFDPAAIPEDAAGDGSSPDAEDEAPVALDFSIDSNIFGELRHYTDVTNRLIFL
jgi:hypothetical protein